MSDRERLMRRIASIDFAIVELHLFLDTHPNDAEIKNKLNDYTKISDELRAEYEKNYGPIQPGSIDQNRWAWISNPWPWDIQGD